MLHKRTAMARSLFIIALFATSWMPLWAWDDIHEWIKTEKDYKRAQEYWKKQEEHQINLQKQRSEALAHYLKKCQECPKPYFLCHRKNQIRFGLASVLLGATLGISLNTYLNFKKST
jgi:hypothetical protein